MSTYEQLDEWRAGVLSEFVDHRVVDALWVDVHIWFFIHLYADLANYNAVYCGVSVRQKDDYTLMVVKVLLGDTPHVVFISGSTATSCMRKLRDKLRDESVNFVVDKYA